MLAHFHHICRGSVPLRVDWTLTNTLQPAKLDKEEIEYIVRLKEHIKKKGYIGKHKNSPQGC